MAKLFLLLVSLVDIISCSIPPSDCSYSASRHLVCQLSSINSRREKTDFSVVPNNTLSLTVLCSEQGIGELEPAGFSPLSNLRHLVIEGCSLRSIPNNAFSGLVSLQTLSLKTGNESPLEVEVGAFSGLENLQSLDLSLNSLRKLPSDELCHLEKLNLLNISYNEIGSAFDLGIDTLSGARGCLPNLHTLDAAHNELTGLETKSIFSLSSLNILNLNTNYIRFLVSDVFSPSLQVLDMSNNQISHLPSQLFQSLPLREVYLANNSLSSLPSGLFSGNFELETLNFAGNILLASTLSANLTQDLPNLLHLDICHNQIQYIPYEFMVPLVNLQSLKLCGNKLSEINFPAPLINLVNLDLSDNQLKNIEPHYFSGLSTLNQLSLSGNHISSVHPSAFRNNSELLILDLSGNSLSVLPESIQNLSKLQTLDLSRNSISVLNPESVNSLSSLWRLQMHDNLLSNLPMGFFSKLESLQVLDLSNNRLQRMEPGALDLNSALRAIRLDGNYLKEIDGIFTKLPQLIWLNVSNNEIQEFDYTLVPSTLHWLDISHNQIFHLGNYFNIENSSLTFLDAGFNKIEQISSSNLPNNLETILLNDNKISDISQYTFFDKQSLLKVDLSVNKLQRVEEPSILLSPLNLKETMFLLGGNPIICDCKMQWFKTINTGDSLENFPVISDLESIYCRLVYTGEQSFIPLVEARNDQFLCSYETHCFSLCQCCQFDSCDCEMTCPDGCSCFHDNSWTKNIIQCSSGEFSSLPDNIPMDATEIFLDGNKLDILRSHTFIGRKNLKSLHLNNSNIEEIENLTFNGLQTLTSLHLENNKLQTLEGFEFSGLSYLRELYLNDNQISSIHDATFKSLKSLEVLFLQGNSIIDFPVWQLAFNPYLVSVRLAENLWNCDCEFMHKFQSWLKLSTTKVSDSELLTCISNDPEQENVLLTTDSDLPCDMSSVVAKNQKQEQGLENYMPLMIAVLASFSMIVILTFIVFGFRHSIRIWVSSKSSERMIESPEPSQQSEDGKLFDAYISYSPLDGPILNQVLPRDLENNYRICLHHRDLASNHLLSDSVHKVSNASKKIIIVLSQNYLQTEWARLDLKAGLLQTLSGGAQKLIFLVAGVIDPNFIDPTLRLLLKTGEVVSISEPSLMNRLEFSVPEFPDTHYYSTCKFPSMNQVSEKRIVSHI